MLEDMRKYVRAGLEAPAAGRSEDVSATMAPRAQSIAEQMSALAVGFLEWSAEARASLLREVKDLVARQVREMGLATQGELEALKGRVARLEAGDDRHREPARGGGGSTSQARDRPGANPKPKAQPKAKRQPVSAGKGAGATRTAPAPGSR